MTGSRSKGRFIELRDLTIPKIIYIITLEFAFHTLLPVLAFYYYLMSGEMYFIVVLVLPFILRILSEIKNEDYIVYLKK